MEQSTELSIQPVPLKRARPFRRAVLGGLGIVMPPLLTIVILVWIWTTIHYYVLDPVTAVASEVLVWSLADVKTSLDNAEEIPGELGVFESNGKFYRRIFVGPRVEYIPLDVYRRVVKHDGTSIANLGGTAIYRRYIELTYLRPIIIVPIFICVFVFLMYMLGNLVAAGLGRIWTIFEQGIQRLPFVSGVYASVKQVTDFMFSDNQLQITRVVAVEYPSRGIWTVAFVTGSGIAELQSAVGEPLLSLLVPTSPAPVTGYTVIAPRKDVLDLDISVDDALQYLVSCGVVVPEEQIKKMTKSR